MAVPFPPAVPPRHTWDALQTGRCIAEAVVGREGQLAFSPLALSRFRDQQNKAIKRQSNMLAGRAQTTCPISSSCRESAGHEGFHRGCRTPVSPLALFADTQS